MDTVVLLEYDVNVLLASMHTNARSMDNIRAMHSRVVFIQYY